MPCGSTPSIDRGAHIQARQQDTVGIGEDGAQLHRAGGLVHRHVGELQLALQRIGAAVIQLQGDTSAVTGPPDLTCRPAAARFSASSSALDWSTST